MREEGGRLRLDLCEVRLEASSGIDPKTGEDLFRCVTNPIWIATA